MKEHRPARIKNPYFKHSYIDPNATICYDEMTGEIILPLESALYLFVIQEKQFDGSWKNITDGLEKWRRVGAV